jgi:hypothetical protein
LLTRIGTRPVSVAAFMTFSLPETGHHLHLDSRIRHHQPERHALVLPEMSGAS